MNHVTVGVYANQSFKFNIVADEDIVDHIEYNKSWRPGRAFFVNGECVNQGYLNDEMIEAWRIKIGEMKFDTRNPTIPYV